MVESIIYGCSNLGIRLIALSIKADSCLFVCYFQRLTGLAFRLLSATPTTDTYANGFPIEPPDRKKLEMTVGVPESRSQIGASIVSEPISNRSKDSTKNDGATTDKALEQIREFLRGLLFGSVNILVQDGVIIQIDRTEKKRMRDNRTNSR